MFKLRESRYRDSHALLTDVSARLFYVSVQDILKIHIHCAGEFRENRAGKATIFFGVSIKVTNNKAFCEKRPHW